MPWTRKFRRRVCRCALQGRIFYRFDCANHLYTRIICSLGPDRSFWAGFFVLTSISKFVMVRRAILEIGSLPRFKATLTQFQSKSHSKRIGAPLLAGSRANEIYVMVLVTLANCLRNAPLALRRFIRLGRSGSLSINPARTAQPRLLTR